MDTDIKPDPCLEAYTKLIKTYNASVIKKFPSQLKNALGKLCFEQAQLTEDIPEWRGGKRTVLAKLIENHQKKPDERPIANYIIGPMNISCHWSKHYEKMIYIFGEYHQNSNECYEKTYSEGPQHIIDYLKQYFLHTHAFIDFYLEMCGFVSPGYSFRFDNLVNRLNIMRSIFQKCVDPQTRNTDQDCYLSRMHYFDIREGTVKGGVNPISIFVQQANLVWIMLGRDHIQEWEGNEEWKRYDMITAFVRNNSSILKVFSKATEEQKAYEEFWHSQIKNFPLIQKELGRVHPPEIKKVIEDFIKKELDGYIQNRVERKDLSESSKYILDLCTVDVKKSKDDMEKHIRDVNEKTTLLLLRGHLEKIITICIKSNALVVDGYLLARLFKKFNINTEKEEKRRSTDEPEEAHNIIIYAGNLHSQIYRKFLKELKIEDPTDKSKFISAFQDSGHAGPIDDPKQPKFCIDMTHFKQPLFSIWDPPSRLIAQPTQKPYIKDQTLTFPLHNKILELGEFPIVKISNKRKSDSGSDSSSGSRSRSDSSSGSSSRSRSRSDSDSDSSPKRTKSAS